MPGKFSFRKNERILKPSDFAKVRKEGKRYSSKCFTVYVLPNGLEYTRLGLSVSARVGNAIKRNRIKRLVRECFRLNKDSFPPSSDILVSAKDVSPLVGLEDVKGELSGAFRRGPRKAPPHI